MRFQMNRFQFCWALQLVCLLNVVPIGGVRGGDTVAKADRRSADTSVSEKSEAEKWIEQALVAEAKGDLVERDRCLKRAIAEEGDSSAAAWFRGRICSEDGESISIEESVQAANSDEQLQAYEARRVLAQDNLSGQWNMTLWCVQQKMMPQARAHARAVLDFDTNHLGARRVLGFQLAGDEWLSKEQAANMSEAARQAKIGFAKYARTLRDIARDASHSKSEVRSKASERLAAIEDEAAVVPVEALLGYRRDEAAELAVNWLSTQKSPATSMALVRIALLQNAVDVRTAAIKELQSRPLHDFVPPLLKSMSSPVVAMFVPALDNNGVFLGFRQVFHQELQDRNNVVVIDTNMNYSARAARERVPLDSFFSPGEIGANSVAAPTQGIDQRSQEEAFQRASVQGAERAARMQANNRAIMERNARIARLLADVSGEEFASDAKAIWSWWDSVNETEHQSLKLSNVRYTSTALRTPNYAEAAARPQFVGECFTRGTLVTTQKGNRPIESIRVGDRVLSRDIGTGELGWQVVLQTTRRQPRAIVEITAGEDTLRSTGGHLFWVSGKGWKKASEILVGDLLHCASEPVVVTKVSEAPEEATYNLQVDQTHTYFVGNSRIMSHDVTDRQHSRIQVPGLLIPVELPQPGE